jgi:hypothetical protein
MLKQQQVQTGFTWISLLIVLTILGGLLTAGASTWQHTRITQAKRVLFHDIARALAFSRTEAFLRGKTLALLPLDTQNHNWALGIQLQLLDNKISDKASDKIHRWLSWHMSKHIHLTWHGFQGPDKVIVNTRPESLAMNGYFLLEGPRLLPERWIVNRFGRIRVLRKHVA